MHFFVTIKLHHSVFEAVRIVYNVLKLLKDFAHLRAWFQTAITHEMLVQSL